jgi:hypothetical protein
LEPRAGFRPGVRSLYKTARSRSASRALDSKLVIGLFWNCGICINEIVNPEGSEQTNIVGSSRIPNQGPFQAAPQFSFGSIAWFHLDFEQVVGPKGLTAYTWWVLSEGAVYELRNVSLNPHTGQIMPSSLSVFVFRTFMKPILVGKAGYEPTSIVDTCGKHASLRMTRSRGRVELRYAESFSGCRNRIRIDWTVISDRKLRDLRWPTCSCFGEDRWTSGYIWRNFNADPSSVWKWFSDDVVWSCCPILL